MYFNTPGITNILPVRIALTNPVILAIIYQFSRNK